MRHEQRKPAAQTAEPKPNRRKSSEETRERILNAALALFNDEGTAVITTNRIAEAAGLSVGNLYYHYKNKEEIILDLFGRVVDDTTAGFAVEPGQTLGLADLERFLRFNQAQLWRYRFFYREMVPLLRRDPELAVAYRSHRERGMANTVALIRYFAASGVLRPIDSADEIRRLAEAAWILSEFYAPFVEAGGEVVEERHFDEAIQLFRQQLAIYLMEPSS